MPASTPAHTALLPLIVVLAALAALASGCPPPPGEGEGEVEPADLDAYVDGTAPTDDEPPTTAPAGLPDDLVLIDLGLVAVQDGKSDPIIVDVHGGVGSFTLIAFAHDEVIVQTAVDPEGDTVVSDELPPDVTEAHVDFSRGFPAQLLSPNRVLVQPGHGTFQFPNTPRAPMKNGEWRIVLGSYHVTTDTAFPTGEPVDRPLHVYLIARPEPGPTSTLNLVLHLSGAQGLTASAAESDETLQGALDVMREAYHEVGVDIGDVVYQDITVANFTEVVLEEGRCQNGDIDQLFSAVSGPPGYVPMFFIDHFKCIVGATDVGAAIGGLGSLPAAPFVARSQHSGVAISQSFHPGDPLALGVLMAHETGHLLSLYHARESNVFGNEPLTDEIDDTPEDLAGAQDNLMYFANATATAISDDQGSVVRVSPFVR